MVQSGLHAPLIWSPEWTFEGLVRFVTCRINLEKTCRLYDHETLQLRSTGVLSEKFFHVYDD